MAIKNIFISDECFRGFSIIVSIHNFSSIQDLTIYIKDMLIANLKVINLVNLIEKAKNMSLHHHTYKFINELNEDPNDIIYLCSCCNNI